MVFLERLYYNSILFNEKPSKHVPYFLVTCNISNRDFNFAIIYIPFDCPITKNGLFTPKTYKKQLKDMFVTH